MTSVHFKSSRVDSRLPAFEKDLKSCHSVVLCRAALPPVAALWVGGRGRGSVATPGRHSNVRARDSVDTRSHLSAVYTFGLDL